jgi:hypothetical protein
VQTNATVAYYNGVLVLRLEQDHRPGALAQGGSPAPRWAALLCQSARIRQPACCRSRVPGDEDALY